MRIPIPKSNLEVKAVSEDDVKRVLERYIGMLGNQVLYDMCRDNPSQQDQNAVVSKFWLIGRAYAASVERRDTPDEVHLKETEDFIRDRFAPVYIEAKLDLVFEPLREYEGVTEENLSGVLELHYTVCQIMEKVTDQWKRSLASKYLHFHFPDLYFIYDSRADKALKGYVPHWTKMELSANPNCDLHYHRFCEAMLMLRDAIQSQYQIRLSPRQLDRLLLVAY